jgi:hypothetical protein
VQGEELGPVTKKKVNNLFITVTCSRYGERNLTAGTLLMTASSAETLKGELSTVTLTLNKKI